MARGDGCAASVIATGTPAEIKATRQRARSKRRSSPLARGETPRATRRHVLRAWPSRAAPAIEAEGLTKRFGNFTAVDHVSFRIETGEIFGFLGSNGCGKTTTMKMLTGLLPATEGRRCSSATRSTPDDIETRQRVGYMSQAFSLYSELTVRQNLELHAQLFHLPASKSAPRVEEMLDEFGLGDVADSSPESLPLGIRQRLSAGGRDHARPGDADPRRADLGRRSGRPR